jgi:hypothetical protein
MRRLGARAPAVPANIDLETASRAFQADLIAQARLDMHRWRYAPATTVRRIVGDGLTEVEFASLVDEFAGF